MKTNFATLVCSMTIAVATIGCAKKSDSAVAGGPVSVSATGSQSGDAMVGALSLALDAPTLGLSTTQKSTIVNAASDAGKKALVAKSLGLNLADSTELQTVSKAIMAGAIGSMNEAGLSAADPTALAQLKSTATAVETSLLESLSSSKLVDGLAVADRAKIVSGMIAGAVGSLDEAGITNADAVAFAGTILQEGTASLKDAGFATTEMGDALSGITAESMAALAESGLPADLRDDAALELVHGTVGGLDTLDLPPEDLQGALADFSASTVANLDQAGIPADSMAAAAKGAFSDIVGSLDSLGFDAASIQIVANDLAQNAVANADQVEGVTVADMASAIAGGVVGGFQDAGLTTAEIQDASADVAKACVGALSDAGVAAGDIAAMSADIKTGVSDGMADSGLSAAEISAAAAALNTSVSEAAQAEQQQIQTGVTWAMGDACGDAPTEQAKIEIFSPLKYADPNGHFCLLSDATFSCDSLNSLVSGGTFAKARDDNMSADFCVFTANPAP